MPLQYGVSRTLRMTARTHGRIRRHTSAPRALHVGKGALGRMDASGGIPVPPRALHIGKGDLGCLVEKSGLIELLRQVWMSQAALPSTGNRGVGA